MSKPVHGNDQFFPFEEKEEKGAVDKRCGKDDEGPGVEIVAKNRISKSGKTWTNM